LERLGYNITYSLLNARYYDVPQNRERVIVIGAKNRIGLPAKKTNQITAGEALGELATQFDENSKYLTPNMDKYIAKYEKASSCINPRDLHMDRPARTLTCRNLAGSTGDMHRIKLPNGKRRRITVREAARLQSFPDWFKFSGNETSQYNQVGNAVAPYFAYHLASVVKQYFEIGFSENSILTIDNQYTLFDNEAIYSSGKVSNL
jgi:DNA (cytosine-5)-methyltransferase 1